jgi:DNA-directed RNA polymerase specialized sigma24 family protein
MTSSRRKTAEHDNDAAAFLSTDLVATTHDALGKNDHTAEESAAFRSRLGQHARRLVVRSVLRPELCNACFRGVDSFVQNDVQELVREQSLEPTPTGCRGSVDLGEFIAESLLKDRLLRSAESRKNIHAFPGVQRVALVHALLRGVKAEVALLPLPAIDKHILSTWAGLRSPFIAHFRKKLGLSPDTAEELFHSAYEKAFFKLLLGHNPKNPGAWFLRLAVNYGVEQRRAADRRGEIPLVNPGELPAAIDPPYQRVMDEERRKWLEAFPKVLAEINKRIGQKSKEATALAWRLRRQLDLNISQVAERLEVTEKTVKCYLKIADGIARRELIKKGYVPWF